MALDVIYKNRNGTTAEWAASTYILLKGEMGIDTDLNIAKIGDGEHTWKDLDIFNKTDTSKFVTLDTEQSITATKTFGADVSEHIEIDAYGINAINQDSSGELANAQLDYNGLALVETTTAPEHKDANYRVDSISFSTSDKNASISLSPDLDSLEVSKSATIKIPAESGTLLVSSASADDPFNATPKNIMSSINIGQNTSASVSSTLIDAGSITFRDMDRNNYEGTTQLVVAQVNNSDPVVVSLPASSGELALKSDMPSTSDFVTVDTTQTVSGSKTFSDAVTIGAPSLNMQLANDAIMFTDVMGRTGTVNHADFTEDAVKWVFPDKSGTIALTDDIPSTDNFVTTDTAQIVSGIKQFSGTNEVYTNYNTTTVGDIIICSSGEDKGYKTTALTPEYLEFRRNNVGPAEVNPWIRLIANPQNYVNFNATITLPDTSGTLALTSDIPNTTKLVTTDTAQTISGVKTFSGNSLEVTGGNNSIALSAMNAYSVPTFTSYIDGNATQIRFPRKSGVFALTNDLPAGEVKVQYGDKISSTGTSTPVNVTIDTSTLNWQDRTITAIQIAFGYEGDASMGYRYQIPLQDLYNFRSSTSSTQGDFRYTFNPSVFNYPVTVSRSSTITTSYSNGTQNYSIPLSINFNNNPAYFYVVLGVIYKGNMYAGSGTY